MSRFSMTEQVAETAAAAAEIQLTDDERQPCEVWTRVMGYHRPVASFNTGKKGEFAERRHFEEGRAALAPAAR
jgi:anaerobic ribonucleoside-triphosphate reductase